MDLPLLGRGRTADVYDLGDGRVLLSSGLEGKVQLRPLAPHSGP